MDDVVRDNDEQQRGKQHMRPRSRISGVCCPVRVARDQKPHGGRQRGDVAECRSAIEGVGNDREDVADHQQRCPKQIHDTAE